MWNWVLDKTFAGRATPAITRSDNGREFTATTAVDRLTDRGVTAAFIEKASPQQICYVERFKGSMRDELLDGELFEAPQVFCRSHAVHVRTSELHNVRAPSTRRERDQFRCHAYRRSFIPSVVMTFCAR
jgi:transposase InsO family protein